MTYNNQYNEETDNLVNFLFSDKDISKKKVELYENGRKYKLLDIVYYKLYPYKLSKGYMLIYVVRHGKKYKNIVRSNLKNVRVYYPKDSLVEIHIETFTTNDIIKGILTKS